MVSFGLECLGFWRCCWSRFDCFLVLFSFQHASPERPLCPTAFLDCIGFELDKNYHETKLQLLFSPILLCVFDACNVGLCRSLVLGLLCICPFFVSLLIVELDRFRLCLPDLLAQHRSGS